MDKAASIRMNNIVDVLSDEEQIDVFSFDAPADNTRSISYYSATDNLAKEDLYSLKRVIWDFILFFRLLARIRRYDVIYAHHVDGGALSVCLKLLTLGNVPVVLDLHGPFIPELQHYDLLSNKYLISVADFAERTVYGFSDHIFVTSDGLEQYVSDKTETSIDILYDYVNLNRFKPMESDALEGYALEDKQIVMYVGMLKDYQGVDYLIRAFAGIDNQEIDPEPHLVIVGNSNIDTYRNIAVEEGIEDSVTFTGLQPHSEIPRYLAASDILVAPRISTEVTQGGFISQLPEYLAMAKPVIASEVSDAGIVLKEGEFGRLVDDANETELKNAITEILQDEQIRDRYASKARDRARDYSWQKNAEMITDTFAAITEG